MKNISTYISSITPKLKIYCLQRQIYLLLNNKQCIKKNSSTNTTNWVFWTIYLCQFSWNNENVIPNNAQK